MKKILTGIFAMIAVLALAGCGGNKTSDSSSIDSNTSINSEVPGTSDTSNEDAENLETAADYIESMYKKQDVETRRDYNVLANAMGCSITWSVSGTESIVVSEPFINNEDGLQYVKIDVDSTLTEDVDYVLTATISNAAGSKVVTFNRKVLKAPATISLADALASEDGTLVVVTGTVCSIGTVWNEQYKNISVTIEDEAGDKLYIYRLATKVELGDVVFVEGTMATYNNSRQIAQGAVADIVGHDSSYDYVEMSIPEAIAAEDNTNVIVSGIVYNIGTPWNEGYQNLSVDIKDTDGNTLYLYRLSTKVTLGDIITVKGTMATYKENRQVTGGVAEITGTHACETYSEATCTAPAACVFCNKAKDDVTLNHNYVNGVCSVCGATDPSQSAPVDPAAKAIIDQLYALADGESATGPFTLTGKITAFDEYNNPTIVVEGLEDKPVFCYKLKLPDHSIGDIITVTAQSMKNYTGTYEFLDCELSTGGEDQKPSTEIPEGAATATLSIADYAAANSWENSSRYAEITMSEGFTITTSGTPVGDWGLNTGKYYSSGSTWRIYQNENPSVVITSVDGLTILAVKVSYAIKNTGTLTLNGANIASDEIVTVNATSITFSVGNTDTATNGQAQITAIEIYYEEAEVIPTYTLTLINGNPRLDPSAVTTSELVEGAAIELATDLTAEGKTFKGWFAMDDNDDLTVEAPATMPAESIALYAVWEITPYTLTIKQEGAEDKVIIFGVDVPSPNPTNIEAPISNLAFVLDGFLSEGYTYAEAIPETFALQNYTFTIVSIEVPKYTLNLVNGNPKMDPEALTTAEYAEGAALELPVLEAEGKIFKGWFSMDENSELTVAAPATMPAETITLHALWEVTPYTLTIVNGENTTEIVFGVEYDLANNIEVAVTDLATVLAEKLPANTEDYTYSWKETVPATFELQDYTFTVVAKANLNTPEKILNAAYALAKDTALDGTFTLTGTIVSIDTAYNSQYKNITVTIVVENFEDKPMLCYRMKGTGAESLGVADVITVTGKIKNYGGTVEFDSGCTFEMVTKHVCSEYTEATCIQLATCIACGATTGELAEHNYVEGVCDVCGADENATNIPSTTVSVTVQSYAASHSWENGIYYGTLVMDDVITVTAKASNNNGKYYTTGYEWRMYQSDKGEITISAAENYIIDSVKITYNLKNGGTLVYDGTNYASNSTVVVNAETMTFTLGSTTGATNGQVKITAIEVVYKAVN